MGAFQPEHAGQLRFYVNHLAEHVAYPEENPPVGILLCAERDAEVVRFATAGGPGSALKSESKLAKELIELALPLDQRGRARPTHDLPGQ